MNKSILEVINWSEPIIENFSSENSVNVAHVEYKTSGWLNGKLTSTYIIHYAAYDPQNPHEAQSTFTGYTIFNGEINGKSGIVVFSEIGEHSNGLVSNLTIKLNTATQELESLTGSAQYTFENGQVVLLSDF